MTVKVGQLHGHLGSTLEQLWVNDPSAQRQIHCVTVVRNVAKIERARYGELAVLGSMLELAVMEAMVTELSRHRAAGLLVPAEFLDSHKRSWLRQQSMQRDIAIGVLGAGTDAHDLANGLNRAVARSRTDPAGVSLYAADSLQALAQTLGQLVGNSVTIESLRHELLAFSAMVGPVDRVREETILRRSGQAVAVAWAIREGYVARVLESDQVVRVPPNPDVGFAGRAACRVAHEGEPLAVIWTTDSARPLTRRDEEVIREAAEAAAAILVRQREVLQREAELRTEILEDIVHGRLTNPESIRTVARSIGWNIDRLRQALVVSIDRAETFRLRHASHSGRQLQRARERLTELVRLETLSVDAEAVIGPRSSGTIVLFNTDDAADETRKITALRLATRIAERFHDVIPDLTVTVGVGQQVPSFEQIAETVSQAELAAHLGLTLWGGNRAVHYSDLGIHRALFTLQQHEEMITPALKHLIEYDRIHGSDFLHTLDVYLGCMGRLRVAAEELEVHRNTLEYRVRRIQEIADVRLEDRDTRLALELGIRLLRLKQLDGGCGPLPQ